MRQIAAFAATVLLSGCGVWSSTIRSNVLDYSKVIDDTADKFLLINILEARDGAPLHFVEMPKITGSLQATATLSAGVPFVARQIGPANGVVTNTITPTISVQSTPVFEVDNLDTKEFVTGMTSSIDPKQVKYWIDHGLDNRLLLLLFFSSVEITRKDCVAPKEGDPDHLKYDTCVREHNGYAERYIKIENDPRRAADVLAPCQTANAGNPDACHALTQFEHYLKLIDRIDKGFIANQYSERSLLAENEAIASRDIAKFDPTKYELEYVADKKLYNIYSVPADKKIVLCFNDEPLTESGGAEKCAQSTLTNKQTSQSIAKKSAGAPIEYSGSGCTDFPRTPEPQQSNYCKFYLGYFDKLGKPNSPYSISLTIRSAGEMVRFVGDLLYYQNVMAQDAYHNVPATLNYDYSCNHKQEDNNCSGPDGGYLFRLNGAAEPQYSVEYHGHEYTVGAGGPGDHTLEVLSVLSLSIALNRSATDIHPTQLLQTIP